MGNGIFFSRTNHRYVNPSRQSQVALFGIVLWYICGIDMLQWLSVYLVIADFNSSLLFRFKPSLIAASATLLTNIIAKHGMLIITPSFPFKWIDIIVWTGMMFSGTTYVRSSVPILSTTGKELHCYHDTVMKIWHEYIWVYYRPDEYETTPICKQALK